MQAVTRELLVLKHADPDVVVELLGLTTEEILEAFPREVERYLHNEKEGTDDSIGDFKEVV